MWPRQRFTLMAYLHLDGTDTLSSKLALPKMLHVRFRVGTMSEQKERLPWAQHVFQGWGVASSFYQKADRRNDRGITTSVSQALEVARRGEESQEEVWAMLSLPLLLVSSHIMKGVGRAIWHLCPGHWMILSRHWLWCVNAMHVNTVLVHQTPLHARLV